MPDFHKFMMRHGESTVQTIIEQIERIEDIRICYGISLEDRWNALMVPSSAQQRIAA